MLLSFTEDDDDGVIGVGDDGVMRMVPLGVVSGAVVGVVAGCRSTLRGDRRSADFAAQRTQRRQHVALDSSSARCRLIGQGC